MLNRKTIKVLTKQNKPSRAKAQTSVEYMLLFAAVMIVVIYGFDTYFPYIRETANIYYNGVIMGVVGAEPPNFCWEEYGGSVNCGTY